MVFQKIDIHPINLEGSKLNLKKHAPTEDEHKRALKWLEGLSIEKSLSDRRKIRLLHDLILFFKIYKKPTNKITREELISIKEGLLNKKILRNDGKPYSDSVVDGLTETIVRYLEYNYPKRMSGFISQSNKPLRSWFIMRCKKKTPEILNENEIKKLYKESKALWQKYAIAVLFSSGARIEEFLNFRFEDFEQPSKNFPYWQVDIKEEYSKTLGRKVGLYWDYCTEAITKYFESIEKKDSKEQVLPFDYDAVRMFLTRLGKKVLDKRVHPHMFRKSSATFFASKLNRQQLCKKFGWKFSSDVVDVYINRAGVDEFEVKDVMLNDDISKLRQNGQNQKLEIERLKRDYEELRAEINNSNNYYALPKELIEEGMDIERYVDQKIKEMLAKK